MFNINEHSGALELREDWRPPEGVLRGGLNRRYNPGRTGRG